MFKQSSLHSVGLKESHELHEHPKLMTLKIFLLYPYPRKKILFLGQLKEMDLVSQRLNVTRMYFPASGNAIDLIMRGIMLRFNFRRD